MVYDCFPFFNELDLLEIRLNELDSVVDKFVLVEATRTFQKTPKPLFYEQNKERYKKFSDKIIHIVVDEYPSFFAKFRVPTAWDYDNHQKDQVALALKGCSSDDNIIISDVDEIPSAAQVKKHIHSTPPKVFEQRLSNFFVNCVAVDCTPDNAHIIRGDFVYWRGAVMVKYKNFSSFKKVRLLRNSEDSSVVHVKNGGWHLSFMGGADMVRKKLDSWAHTKEEKYNPEHLQSSKKLLEIINRGEDLFDRNFSYKFIDVDESFPKFFVDNQEHFGSLIKE